MSTEPLGGGSAISRYFRSAGVRLAVLPVTGLASLLSARVIADQYEPAGYGVFTLIATLPLLIPFADFGLGAALTNAAAARRSHPEVLRYVLRRSLIILSLVGAAVATSSLVLGALGLWSLILNLPPQAPLNWAVGTAVATFGLGMPGSLGLRLLIGYGRNATAVALQAMAPLVTLILVATMAASGAPLDLLIALSLLGAAAANWLSLTIGLRVHHSEAGVPHAALSSSTPPPRLLQTALPAVLVSILLPLTFQSGRTVLAWTSGMDQVAAYSAAMSLYLPALSVLQAAATSLWADFARARSTGTPARSLFYRSLIVSTTIGAIGGAGLAIAGPWVVWVVIDPSLSVGGMLFPALGLLLAAQAFHQPSGMYLTSPRGLAFQAITAAAMAAIAVPASIWASERAGALGVVLSMLVAFCVAQVTPSAILSMKRVGQARR